MRGETTPNPVVRRFTVPWSGQGERTRADPGLEALWRVARVRSVLLGEGFCAVTLDGLWDVPTADAVAEALARSEAPAGARPEGARVGPPTLRDKVEAILDFELRPGIAAHGGAVELVDVADGVVSLKLRGACRACPASAITLQGQVLAGLQRWLPEVKAVREAGE